MKLKTKKNKQNKSNKTKKYKGGFGFFKNKTYYKTKDFDKKIQRDDCDDIKSNCSIDCDTDRECEKTCDKNYINCTSKLDSFCTIL